MPATAVSPITQTLWREHNRDERRARQQLLARHLRDVPKEQRRRARVTKSA